MHGLALVEAQTLERIKPEEAALTLQWRIGRAMALVGRYEGRAFEHAELDIVALDPFVVHEVERHLDRLYFLDAVDELRMPACQYSDEPVLEDVSAPGKAQ